MSGEVSKTYLLVNTFSIVHGLRLGHVIGVYDDLFDARDNEKEIVRIARGLWRQGKHGGVFQATTIVVEVRGDNHFKKGDWFPEVDFDNSDKFVNHG